MTPRIGFLWGDFPWAAPPRQVGKLLSMGATARVLQRALGAHGTVVPYRPPSPAAAPAVQRDALARFLGDIDILLADLYPASEPALRLRHELDRPCSALLFAGGALPKGAEAMLFPWQDLLRPGDGLLFTCRADRDIWRRLVRSSALHEWIVPLGIDDSVFRPPDPAACTAVRARHGLPPDAPLLLYVGRLNIQKGLHHALRTLAAVRRTMPDAHLCFVGAEDDIGLWEFGVPNTGYVAWLRALAADLGVADAVTFVGLVFGANLAALYGAADVLLNLGVYHRENFGLSQAEAQACGLPVVCTTWGGFKDVVGDSETGYLVDATLTKHGVRVDWATAAARIVALLRDRPLRTRLGAAAADRAHRHFSIAALSNAMAPVLAGLLATSSARQRASADAPAYLPSPFARRYEAHKRAGDWYATPAEPTRRSPPLFEGRDYALYETLMAPYATRLAGDLAPDAICPTWVPYFPAPVTLEPIRRIALGHDPIWPHRCFPSPIEWTILKRIDGTAPIAAITVATGIALADTTAALWRLHLEGFLLFRQPPHEAYPPLSHD